MWLLLGGPGRLPGSGAEPGGEAPEKKEEPHCLVYNLPRSRQGVAAPAFSFLLRHRRSLYPRTQPFKDFCSRPMMGAFPETQFPHVTCFSWKTFPGSKHLTHRCSWRRSFHRKPPAGPSPAAKPVQSPGCAADNACAVWMDHGGTTAALPEAPSVPRALALWPRPVSAAATPWPGYGSRAEAWTPRGADFGHRGRRTTKRAWRAPSSLCHHC